LLTASAWRYERHTPKAAKATKPAIMSEPSTIVRRRNVAYRNGSEKGFGALGLGSLTRRASHSGVGSAGVHPVSTSAAVVALTTRAVSSPRSFWRTESSGPIAKVITPEIPYIAG
jgi:hypothetical protein